jgi:hypothetical protein
MEAGCRHGQLAKPTALAYILVVVSTQAAAALYSRLTSPFLPW